MYHSLTMGNTLSEVFAPSTPAQIDVVATGDWRINIEDAESRYNKLKNKLPEYLNLSFIPQKDEGIKGAQCAHRYMVIQGYIDELIKNSESVFDEPLFLYIGAGRGSTQITLLKMDGTTLAVFKGPGYPKNGDSPNIALNLICEDIKRVHDGSILGIFGYDSIFHVLKSECPVVKDESLLPEAITTTGNDFEKLGYLVTQFPSVPMLVFRNFKTKDNIMRKATFLDGDELKIDLGSGEAKLTDTSNGQQISVVDLPEDWKTNEESLDKVASILDDMAHYSEENIDEDEDEEEVGSYWNFLKYGSYLSP